MNPNVRFNARIVNNGCSCISPRISDQRFAMHSDSPHTDNNCFQYDRLWPVNMTGKTKSWLVNSPISPDIVRWPAVISSPGLGMTEIRVWPEQTCCERVHVEKRVNLPFVTGSNYLKSQEFYESVNRNYNALLSMREADMLRGFVMSTLHKLPQERPNIARTDENWENWDMEASINNFQQWLKRHKVGNAPGNSRCVQLKREKH